MILPDVNVLIYAFRAESENHPQYRSWLLDTVNGDEPFGLSELVCSSILRIVTNARVFSSPATMGEAMSFIDSLRSSPACVIVSPDRSHWDIFRRLLLSLNLRGDVTTDAYLAALAIESGSEWITTDRDFARFPGLQWRHPLS
jgi:toxin-antitoxin system PIN domain toxin